MVTAMNYFKRSITRRFVAMMLVFLTLIFVGALALFGLNYTTLKKHQMIESNLKQKQELVSDIYYHTYQIFFRARGYYAFKNNQEYDAIFTEKQKLEVALEKFRMLNLNPDESQLAENVDHFFTNYFNVTLPKFIQAIHNNDYATIRKLSSSGVNQTVNDLVAYANEFKHFSDLQLKLESEHLSESISSQGELFLLYFFGILLVAIWVTFRTAKDVGTPLNQLSSTTDQIARGEQVEMQGLNRPDEIGHLSRSFQYMMVQIQAKEEELLAQNEELQAQQDELQMQQEELQEALAKTEENERYLEKRNKLIMSLANTLNNKELLSSIIRNMVEVTHSDKGLIVLLNQARDHAGFGVTEQGVSQFLDQLEQGMLVRILGTKQPYEVTRQQTISEKGYHLDAAFGYDLFLPVLNANSDVIACIVLTRFGKSVTKQEMREVTGLAKQISLSLEKLAMYEETEKQRQLTQDMLDTIQEGVQLLDPDGVTIQANRQMYELLGDTQDGSRVNTSHDQLYTFLHGKVTEPERLMSFIADAVQGRERAAKTIVYEVNLATKRYIQMYDVPLYRGKDKLGTLLVHRDITREYEVDLIKSEFVSTVSHELRTPLASVLGFTELLMHKELTPERQRKYLQTIHQEAIRLTNLVNDFLDLQRMESGRQSYEMSQINLVPLIKEAIELQKVNALSHHFRFVQKTSSSAVVCDTDKMRQVLMNLLSNAVKYSPQGGNIQVTYEEANGLVKMNVSDEGLGIPEEALPNLFTKFYRVDNSDRREIGGTGLGLAIVKEILTYHNGDISVSSIFGRGSTFTIRLPLSGGGQPYLVDEAASATESTAFRASGRVAIIEDDTNLAELLKEELEGSGYTVFHYDNGHQALQEIKALLPDAVVLDLILNHEMDGWQVIAEMKQDEAMEKIPILISSAFEEKNRALELGAKGYLIKPYNPHLLTEVLKKTIEKRERDGHILVPADGYKSR